MNYTTYNPATGELLGQFTTTSPDILELNLKNSSYIEGKLDSRKFYLDLTTLQPVDKPRDPSTPYSKYDFDWATKTWVLNPDQTAKLTRQYRDQFLALVDRVNPVWYNELTAEQKTELQQFRQALLDITQQSGFPETVVWPPKPVWL